MLHSSPLPSFVLGVRDRNSIQGMGHLLLQSPTRSLSQVATEAINQQWR